MSQPEPTATPATPDAMARLAEQFRLMGLLYVATEPGTPSDLVGSTNRRRPNAPAPGRGDVPGQGDVADHRRPGGLGPATRRVGVDPEEWDDCLRCHEFDHCHKLSTAGPAHGGSV